MCALANALLVHTAIAFLGISQFCQVHYSTAIFAFSRSNNLHVGTRGGGKGTNKCEGMSIGQVRQRTYTKPGKAGSPPAIQECQGKVSASALVVGNREIPGINTLAPESNKQEQEDRGNKGSRLWRRPNELI